MARRERFWNADRTEKLKALVVSGQHEYKDIARILGAESASAISGKVDRLRIGRGRVAPRKSANSKPRRLPTAVAAVATTGSRRQRGIKADRGQPEIESEGVRSRVLALDAVRDRATLVQMATLEDCQCRYPYSDAKETKHEGFCGRDAVLGKSYCPEHLAVCEPAAAVKLGFRIIESRTEELQPTEELELT